MEPRQERDSEGGAALPDMRPGRAVDEQACPHCGRLVSAQARRCRHCKMAIGASRDPASPDPPAPCPKCGAPMKVVGRAGIAGVVCLPCHDRRAQYEADMGRLREELAAAEYVLGGATRYLAYPWLAWFDGEPQWRLVGKAGPAMYALLGFCGGCTVAFTPLERYAPHAFWLTFLLSWLGFVIRYELARRRAVRLRAEVRSMTGDA